ncbi:hypothetical protein HRR81_009397 [Exophiala dermatitidis]|nr:hypothetical protein HRR79_009307 [Exophiala dermatitidis]KAJ4561512.1 hypothetical protein HRR81_009397 [Exophiala dermatitidis]KAJ4563734.1 hypothetical protein HRR82_009359 [Exophiala dermatitidis]KAJ4588571.1 hypothetical protein HRR84_008366 [Exophiala dermatitidis]KAJ4611024.1 hypothetical protein HRR86_009397 [Exophiala dermatitidis]
MDRGSGSAPDDKPSRTLSSVVPVASFEPPVAIRCQHQGVPPSANSRAAAPRSGGDQGVVCPGLRLLNVAGSPMLSGSVHRKATCKLVDVAYHLGPWRILDHRDLPRALPPLQIKPAHCPRLNIYPSSSFINPPKSLLLPSYL